MFRRYNFISFNWDILYKENGYNEKIINIYKCFEIYNQKIDIFKIIKCITCPNCNKYLNHIESKVVYETPINLIITFEGGNKNNNLKIDLEETIKFNQKQVQSYFEREYFLMGIIAENNFSLKDKYSLYLKKENNWYIYTYRREKMINFNNIKNNLNVVCLFYYQNFNVPRKFNITNYNIINNYEDANNFKDIFNKETNEQLNNKIKELENKLQSKDLLYLNKIHSLENIINQKDEELNLLREKLKNIVINDNRYQKNSKIIKGCDKCVIFISNDENLIYGIPCSGDDIFAEIEEILYREYPEYRGKNNIFLNNGKEIIRSKTINENNIETGKPIMLIRQ